MIQVVPRSNLQRHLASLALGLLGAFGMGPFYAWPILLVSLSLFWLVFTQFATSRTWHSCLAGFLYGFGFFTGSLWWIGNALLVGGNPYAWAYPFAAVGLPFLFAFYPLLACGLTRWLKPGRSLSAFACFGLLMFLAEYGRGHLFTGFAWNLSGMAWTGNLAMLQILSVGGIYLLTFLSVFMFLAPAFAWKGDAPRLVRIFVLDTAITCAIALYIFGTFRLHDNPTAYNDKILIQVIQPNIMQEDKWNGDKVWDNYRSLLQLMQPDPVETYATPPATRLLVAPETAMTYHELAHPEARAALLGRLSGYSEPNIYLLTGALLRDDAGYHNALIALDKWGNRLQSFDKFHLVPFGEYIPFQQYVPFGPLVKFQGFAEGPGPRTLTLPDAPPFSPLVCYEVIFPAAVTDKNSRPDWIVNVTNDAWYGISPGPIQHLAQAQYRAIEEGLPVVRSANTGISAIFDAYGRPVLQTGLYGAANSESLLPRPAASQTIYSRLP